MPPLSWHPACFLLLVLLFSFINAAFADARLSDETLHNLPRPGSDFHIKDGSLLAPILIPRVPGTPGSIAVLNHFVDFFRTELPDWNIELQNSTSTTPTSEGEEIPFRNFIASRDPPRAREGDSGRLTLVAHYDSKLQPDGFIGAVDSAAPCAMIMHAARSIDAALTKKWTSLEADGTGGLGDLDESKGVQVIFLDGEEAFRSWTDTDSTYGARSLAEEWDQSFHPAMRTHKTRLESISLFVLLDLLGAKDPKMPSWFRTTHWAYQLMAGLEKRLREMGEFKSGDGSAWLTDAEKDAHTSSSAFHSYAMEDDHLPFMARGVEVLHLIPSPFPAVWHRMEDDGEHLDGPTVEDWAMLTTAFAAEWLELEGFFDRPSRSERHDRQMIDARDSTISKTEL